MEDMMQEPEQVLEYVKNNEILNKQSKTVVRKYISLAKHCIFIEEENKSKEILINLGFSLKTVNKFIKLAKAELNLCDDDFKKMLMGRISSKHLN
jgi:hypothetical protein